MDAWSGYWKTGARRSPATISITLIGATPPRRSLRFWRNYGPTLIHKQGEWRLPHLGRRRSQAVTRSTGASFCNVRIYENRRRNWRLTFAAADFLVGPQLIDSVERPVCARGGHSEIVGELDCLVVIGDTLAIERRAGRLPPRGSLPESDCTTV